MTLFTLKPKEYTALQALNAHVCRRDEWRRAQALVWLTDGESVVEIAERLTVSRQSVYNWVQRFRQRDDQGLLQRLRDGERSGRPRTAKGIIDALIAEVIDRDPQALGYNATIWTVALLKHYLQDEHGIEVSDKSISRTMARLGIRWKRPRHQLALRPETWRQAKGG
jgi:transposase